MRMRCPHCGSDDLIKQPYKQPYLSPLGNVIHESLMEVYICSGCDTKITVLPNDTEDSLGAGLFEED